MNLLKDISFIAVKFHCVTCHTISAKDDNGKFQLWVIDWYQEFQNGKPLYNDNAEGLQMETKH